MSDRAVLLANLGSPASPEVADVRRYLNQFLMDPYVIDRKRLAGIGCAPWRERGAVHASIPAVCRQYSDYFHR